MVNLAAPLPVNPGLRNCRLVMMSVSVDPLSTNAQTSLAAETAAAGSWKVSPACLSWVRKSASATGSDWGSDWGSAYAGGAIASIVATLVSISRRFTGPESSKVAARAHLRPNAQATSDKKVQMALTPTWPTTGSSPPYPAVPSEFSSRSVSATVNGNANSSSGRPSAATPSHNSTRPAAAITTAPTTKDQTTWPRSPELIN
jgi:hypothetical protein